MIPALNKIKRFSGFHGFYRLGRLSKLISLITLAGIIGITASVFSDTQANTKANKRPNIILAIADDWSFGHAGAYGCEWVETPAFDRLASNGLLFSRAYTPNAKCAPSRAIILTGRYSWQLEEAGNHMSIFPAKYGGYVETLAANGYHAGFTGKGWGPGIAKDEQGRPRAITGKAYSNIKAPPPTRAISNVDYASNFEAFLKDASEGQPWVFWYGTTEPHRGYEYGSGARSGKKLEDVDHVPAYWPDNETIRNDILDYALEVEHYDNHLGRILKTLEERGELENTLIVATSDHGMPFPRAKGQAYDESNHIPLAIHWPKGIRGQGLKIEDYVSFADLAPTFLEVAGLPHGAPIMQPITGRSLTTIFKSDQSGQVESFRDHVVIGKERHDIGRPNAWGYPIRGIVKNDKLYLKNFEIDRWPAGNPETGYLNCDASPTKTWLLNQRRTDGSSALWDLNFGKRSGEEFYDLMEDPDCVNNLVGCETHDSVVEQMRSQLFSTLRTHGDPRMYGAGSVFDNYPYSSAATDHYYERFMGGEKVKAGWVSTSDYEEGPLD